MIKLRLHPLRRYYGDGDLHFITTSCYRRKPLLGSVRARDIFLEVFEQVRRKFRFDVVGFVVMPEHVHLLISEPEETNPSVAMQVIKQRVARRLLGRRRRRNRAQLELWSHQRIRRRFWQKRFYDFNVFSDAKRTEKLRYMHRNPVKRGLVSSPDQWRWSSYRLYAFGERGPLNMDWFFPPYVMRRTKPRHFGEPDDAKATILRAHPSKTAKSAAPTLRSSTRKITQSK